MIYFLQPIAGGPVKIGFSDDVPTRHRQLEGHYGQPLTLLATIEGGRQEELVIHRRFGHLRFGQTEQFRPGPELMEFIGRPLLVDANPDAVEAMEPQTCDIITIRVSVAWRAWLEELSEFLRTPTSTIVDHALVEYAKAKGFKREAPLR